MMLKIGLLILVLFISVTLIAVSSIGMEAFNQNKQYKEKNMSNYVFMGITTALGTIGAVGTLGFGGYSLYKKVSGKGGS